MDDKGRAHWNPEGFQQLPANLKHLREKSVASIKADLTDLWNETNKEGEFFQRDRMPNGPVLPVPVFIDSLSDFFHDESMKNEEFLVEALEVMGDTAHKFHYQLVTKRTKNMMEFSHRHPFPENVWAMTTLETTDPKAKTPNYVWDAKNKVALVVPAAGLIYTAKTGLWSPVPTDGTIPAGGQLVRGCPANWYAPNGGGIAPWERPEYLLRTNAKQKGFSIEPMTGAVDFTRQQWKDMGKQNVWLIIGAESDGDDSKRPMIRLCDLKPELEQLLARAKEYGLPVWFKQWGSWDETGKYIGGKSEAGHKVAGMNVYQWPKILLDAQRENLGVSNGN